MFQIALKLIAWVYFSLSAPSFNNDQKSISTGCLTIIVWLGIQNGLQSKKGLYEKAILIKQGFTNFEYVVVDDKGAIDKKTQ
jgi:hypothetical protein